jgi:hypothetical protein
LVDPADNRDDLFIRNFNRDVIKDGDDFMAGGKAHHQAVNSDHQTSSVALGEDTKAILY